jgi:hypothetical protein
MGTNRARLPYSVASLRESPIPKIGRHQTGAAERGSMDRDSRSPTFGLTNDPVVRLGLFSGQETSDAWATPNRDTVSKRYMKRA